MSDITLIGAGPLGLASALALHRRGLDVALVDARPAPGVQADARSLALSHGSRELLELLDAWPADATPITRTFPVNGRFEGAARDIYALVLGAQKAALAECQPGKSFSAPHDTVVRILSQGLLDLGLLKGSLDEVLETSAYRRFYMHRTSHWLGLDVHDAGEYKQAGDWRVLEAGMVLTIEPGCYIRPADDVPEPFWNIGIRIEDDAVVTAGGCELITEDAPKAVADIEALMRENRALTT